MTYINHEMGQSKVSSIYTDREKSTSFMIELLQDVETLEKLIEQGDIESGLQRIGAEQEFCFVDQNYRPAPVIMSVLEKLDDLHFTEEHARFNGEINLDPLELKSGCFAEFESTLKRHIAKLRKIVHSMDCDIILTGILPTISQSDLSLDNITPKKRYKMLSSLLTKLRGKPYEFRIEGADQFIDNHDSTMMEACNTSFQIHLQLGADEISDAYNWSQAIAGPVLSCTTNSPLLFGKKLWRETRIALFQQSLDTRTSSNSSNNRVPRVTFGSRWVKDSIVEIYKEDIIRHPLLLGARPINTTEEVQAIPKLRALAIHNGTIYRWNRPCYGITEGKPHLRIECRYLPAGPTIVDQVANSAFWIGLMMGLPKKYKNISARMDFDDARSNFIKAARMGLGAQFQWMKGKRVPAKHLILEELIPLAKDGLKKTSISVKESERYLDIIRQRVHSEQTGSQWIMDTFSGFKKKGTIQDALLQTTAGLINHEKSNMPVHKWSSSNEATVTDPRVRYRTVSQVMSTDLIIASPTDPIELIIKSMEWRGIHHILIVDGKGQLAGLISDNLLKALGKTLSRENLLAKDIMIQEPLWVDSEMEIQKARLIMRRNQIGSLPVLRNNKVAGIITQNDLKNLSLKASP